MEIRTEVLLLPIRAQLIYLSLGSDIMPSRKRIGYLPLIKIGLAQLPSVFLQAQVFLC